MHETIRVGEMSVTFLKTRHETAGTLDLFELIIPPQRSVLIPHTHREYDEVIFGMNGIVTWTVAGQEILVGHGEKLSIPRGTPHFFINLHSTTARLMCLQTPGLLGPEYFREVAVHFGKDGKPDIAGISAVMMRYGVIPLMHERQLTGIGR
jgi:mannose-6-phosphate isomerase-like protein (cupin superfamily)